MRPTQRFLVLVIVGIVAWEILALVDPGDGTWTITQEIRLFVHRFPWALFLAGFVCGHLFWCNKRKAPPQP